MFKSGEVTTWANTKETPPKLPQQDDRTPTTINWKNGIVTNNHSINTNTNNNPSSILKKREFNELHIDDDDDGNIDDDDDGDYVEEEDDDVDRNDDTIDIADSSLSSSNQDIDTEIVQNNDRIMINGYNSNNRMQYNDKNDINKRYNGTINSTKKDDDIDGNELLDTTTTNICKDKSKKPQQKQRQPIFAIIDQHSIVDMVDKCSVAPQSSSIASINSHSDDSNGTRISSKLSVSSSSSLSSSARSMHQNSDSDSVVDIFIGSQTTAGAPNAPKKLLKCNQIPVINESNDNDDDGGDPYAALEFYLENVKREINEQFEQSKLNTQLQKSNQMHINKLKPSNGSNNHCTINTNQNGFRRTANSVQDEEKMRKTVEWANSILSELDNLLHPDKHSGNSMARDAESQADHFLRNAAQCNILQPEKHVYIPLQSFHLEKTLRESSIMSSPRIEKSIDDNPLLVLKIEEDSLPIDGNNKRKDIRLSKTISTQTNYADSKKGSTSTIWTSEESILRSTVDDDNKSTSSSSVCEVASGLLSSGKSGNSLNSSGLDNDNNESGIGTATPPKDHHDTWRGGYRGKDFDILSLQNFDKNSWVRHENVTTQTNTSPSSTNVQKNKCYIIQDDPDLLEVLSLCEETVDDNESPEIEWNPISVTDNDSDVYSNKITIFETCDQARNCSCSSIPISKSHRKCTKSESDFHQSTAKIPVINDHQCNRPVQRPSCLRIPNDQCHNKNELPSPSTTSLHSYGNSFGLRELSVKSNSAPILLKEERRLENLEAQLLNLRYSRSQSDRYLAEIEAIEACKWLRAAGFPQYAQMYEDMQFPIDLSNVAKDHPFLENDPLQSLYRRLVALNRCATMRLDSSHKQPANKDDSEEDEYALSDNWQFEKKNRRWSRVDEIDIPKTITMFNNKSDKNQLTTSRDSSPDRDDPSGTDTNVDYTIPLAMSMSQHDSEPIPVRFRRSGSERLKDGAKAFLRRVESIKSRRRKRQNRDGVIISEPQALNLTHINQKMSDLKCVDVVTMSTPPSPIPTSPYGTLNSRNLLNNNDLKVLATDYSKYSSNRLSPRHLTTSSHHKIYQTSQSNRTSPLHFFANSPNIVIELNKSDESSSYYSDGSQDSNIDCNVKKRPFRTRRFLQKGSSKVEDIGAVSDSECHHLDYVQKKYYKEASPTPVSNTPGATELKPPKLHRGGSLNLGKESNRYRDAFKSKSFRSRSSSRRKDGPDTKDLETKTKFGTTVVRWHSFQSNDRPDNIFKKCFPNRAQEEFDGTPLAAMSCGQLQVIRKLALVTLTGYMERYCPTHRTGWNWELPKFIKKIKAPDYKDKKVFGVPFLLLLQRTGETLPKSIQTALKWLKLNAMDQIGIFRKSGVKSRILKLKTVVEESPVESMSLYDVQQAYDVADMVKQYFRELPDMLLTAKMSETFMAIFQHLPPEVRADAVQCGVLLLPDEHREVLQHLLEFLHNVAENADYNQMTAHNLAVCLAPSLFHGVVAAVRTNTASPRRRKLAGVPDPRELSDAKASHECLTYLIENCRSVFTITSEKITRCNFGYMEESRPVPLEALGEGLQVHDWRGYLYECVSATIKEGRERSRGWVSTSSLDNSVEIAYKKVGDGHPLRLWRCVTEVDAPPNDVLQYVFKERHNWDQHLLKWRIIEQLDDKSQIYQYATGAHTVTDFCVLRSWRSDLPRGACVIVETSVEHAQADLLMGGVRGVVLASRYLIEPSGSGRSKIMHLARVDIKGKTPEWYNKTYGHICSHHLARIKNSFKQITDAGPESKV